MARMRIFWSVYCILLGVILLLKLLFRWDFSAWNAALSMLFLQSILFLITGGFGMSHRRYSDRGGLHCFFGGQAALPDEQPESTFLFSEADILPAPPPCRLSVVRCVFSTITIRIPEGCSVRAVCRTAFGSITTPDASLRGFDDRVLIIGDGLQTQLQVQCLFSQVTILD